MKKLSKAEKMQFETMKEHRNMPFLEIGLRVEACGGCGEIVGAINGNLGVKFDGEKHASNCHPTYDIKYFSKSGEVIAEYGE